MSTRLANYTVEVGVNSYDRVIFYDCDGVSINPAGELFICDDDDKVIADYPRMGWVDVTITRNYDS